MSDTVVILDLLPSGDIKSKIIADRSIAERRNESLQLVAASTQEPQPRNVARPTRAGSDPAMRSEIGQAWRR